MAIKKIVEDCSLDQFTSLFLTKKEWREKLKKRGIRKAITHPFLDEGILATNLKKQNIMDLRFFRVFLVNSDKNNAHAFLGIHKPGRWLMPYLGAHVYASCNNNNLALKGVDPLEYYKSQYYLLILLSLFAFVLPGILVIALYIWGKRRWDRRIDAKILPAILDSLTEVRNRG